MSEQAYIDLNPRPKCDHICLLDAGHVDRGEPHFYGYEMPGPRDGNHWHRKWADSLHKLTRLEALIKGYKDDPEWNDTPTGEFALAHDIDDILKEQVKAQVNDSQ